MNEEIANTVGHIIVFGNEKGGCGKSTAAMHAVVALMRMGYRVGTMDLDARQGTFSRYIANRFHTRLTKDKSQPVPQHIPIPVSQADTLKAREDDEAAAFFKALEELTAKNDFVVIDTPGTHSHLSRLAHRFADTLVTPVNDSMIDIDLLADINPDTGDLRGPSVYSRHVMAVREARKKELNMGFRWIVMRNRMSPHKLKSKRDIEALLKDLGARLGFTYLPGFTERVIFREMFLRGLTLLDLPGGETGKGMSPSELAARQEVRYLAHAIVPPEMRVALIKRRKLAQTG